MDSAGTGDWHLGHQMDAHAAAELSRRGYDGSAHRARQVRPSWLADRDLADLRRLAAQAGAGTDRIRLFGEAGGLASRAAGGLDIPDPYGGDASDFGAVLDLIEEAAEHIAVRLTGLLAGRAPA